MGKESGPNEPTGENNVSEVDFLTRVPIDSSNVVEHPTAHANAIEDPAVAEQVARMVSSKEEAVLAAQQKVEEATSNLGKKVSFFGKSREGKLDDAKLARTTARLEADALTNLTEYEINRSRKSEQ